MARQGHTTFEKPHVLVVEGLDDFHVVVGVLAAMQIDSVHIVWTDGVENLGSRLKVYAKTPGWANVRRLGILVDSDNDPAARLDSIRSALGNAQLPVPRLAGDIVGDGLSVLYSTLPAPDAVGRLETVIASAVPDAARVCIDQFMSCAGVADDGVSGRHEKTFVHAYIAATAEPGAKIGEAITAGVLDVSGPAFEPIRVVLRALVT